MRSWSIGLGTTVALALAGHSVAGIAATCTVDGETQSLAATYQDGLFRLLPGSYTFGGARLEILPQFDTRTPDAQIAYGLSTIDTGVPSTFAFSFSVPIALDPGPVKAESSIVGGLTDFTGDGVGIAVNGLPKIQQLSVTGGDPNTALVNVGESVSIGAGPPGANATYGSYAVPLTAVPAGTWQFLKLDANFTSSGNSDITALTGFGRLVVVPAPASMALVALGAGVLVHRRRARTSR